MRSFLLILLFPMHLFAQDISGVWTGLVHTRGQDLPYELVITEKNNELSGYSLIIFTIDSIENVGIKSVSLNRKKGKITIEDDRLLYNNYSSPARRIKLLGLLSLAVRDSVMTLTGNFRTRVLDLRATGNNNYTGTITLQKKKDDERTRLMAHLDTMNLRNTLSFLQPEQEKPLLAIVRVERFPLPVVELKDNTAAPLTVAAPLITVIPVNRDRETDSLADVVAVINNKAPAGNPTRTATEPGVAQNEPKSLPAEKEKQAQPTPEKLPEKNYRITTGKPVLKKNEPVVAQNEPKSLPAEKEKQAQPAPEKLPEKNYRITTGKPVLKKNESVVAQNEPKSLPAEKEKQAQPAPEKLPVNKNPVTTTQPTITVTEPVVGKNAALPQPGEQPKNADTTFNATVKNDMVSGAENPPLHAEVIKPTQIPQPANAAAEVAERKTVVIRDVYFRSDTLLLSLYDNGVVDGDTVSVLLNGNVIIARQKLTEKALRVKVEVTPDLGDSLLLIMYAENLGSIPPNTGLLIIQDGEERSQVRFEGDLQKSSAVILRRKR